MRKISIVAVLVVATFIAGCSSDSDDRGVSRAVVIMSGGGAVSPFTTPTQACSSDDGFLEAGNTDTALRESLLAAGKQVYTAPAMVPWGTAVSVKGVVRWNGQCTLHACSFSGLRRTEPMGVQLRVPAVHRRGVRTLALV